MTNKECGHISKFDFENRKKAKSYTCVECEKIGDKWVHLRTCQVCGETHCCDSSPNQHATNHFRLTGHELVISAEPGEKWAWCYQDKSFKKYQ